MHDHMDNIVIKVLIILWSWLWPYDYNHKCQTDLSLNNPFIVDIVLFNREGWVHPPPELLIDDDHADNEDNGYDADDADNEDNDNEDEDNDDDDEHENDNDKPSPLSTWVALLIDAVEAFNDGIW